MKKILNIKTCIHNTISYSTSSSSSSSKFRFINAFNPAKTAIKQLQFFSMSTFGNVAMRAKLNSSLLNTLSWVKIFLAL